MFNRLRELIKRKKVKFTGIPCPLDHFKPCRVSCPLRGELINSDGEVEGMCMLTELIHLHEIGEVRDLLKQIRDMKGYV